VDWKLLHNRFECLATDKEMEQFYSDIGVWNRSSDHCITAYAKYMCNQGCHDCQNMGPCKSVCDNLFYYCGKILPSGSLAIFFVLFKRKKKKPNSETILSRASFGLCELPG
jgi:hypothetical protein